MMNYREKGVTMVSLTVYIIVSVVVLSSLTFLNINVIKEIATLSNKGEWANELLRAESFLINDIKGANRVLEYSDKYLRLDNNVEYSVKYRANEKQNDQTFDVYELYRGNILITDKMSNISFDYGSTYDSYLQDITEEWIIVDLYDLNYSGGRLYIKVGKGY